MNDFVEKPTAFRGPFDRAYTRLSVSTRQTPLAELPAPVQDEIPISQLPLAGLITGDEMTAIVQNGITSRATINAVALASGLNPGLINKTVTLIYSAQVEQTDFSLSLPDHFGNSYPLSISNALHVTVDGVRFIEDDGSGSFGNYTVNIGSNTVTLLVPLSGGNDVVFDVFNINVQDVTLDSAINTQPLIVTAPNTLSALAFVPNGSMTIIYVNGRAFSDDSIPPSFTVTGQLITWVDPLISIAPTDEVIAAYTYNGPGGGGGGGSGITLAINTQPLIVTAPNTLSALAFVPNGSMTIIYVNGRAFSDDSIPPSFTVTGQLITWVDPLFSINPGDEVIAAYAYNGSGGGGGGGGGSGIPEPPADGTLYGRENGNWLHISHTDIQDWAPATAAFAPLNSPAFTGAPSLPSGATGVTATPGDNSRALATTAFVGAAFAPPASTTPPLMDGAAAPGMSLAWSRGDHVHPSDTSRAPAVTGGYLALSGGVMAGPLTVLAPTAALQAANRQYVDASRYGDNRVINGDMRIDQRWSGAAGTASGYTVDRWQYTALQAAKGNWQRLAGPVVLGFSYCLGFISSSSYAALASDYFLFMQSIEADTVSDFAWGTANAQPVTLSFLVSSTLTGTFGGSIRNAAGTRSYPFSYLIPTANIWTKIILNIPGDATGTWVISGNAASLLITFSLGIGASFAGFPANAWVAGNFIAPTGTVSVVGTSGATFNVTGVKLEIGSVATPFNRQSLAKSMADCQRYYQKLGGVVAYDIAVQGYFAASGQAGMCTLGITPMRAAPTVAQVGAWTTVSLSAINIYPGLSTIGLQIVASAAANVIWATTGTSTYLTASAEL